jgi:Thioredoxin domain
MAMESERVTADVIEANEFPTLSAAYAVQAVPKTVVNDQVEFLGAMPEGRFMQEVWQAVPADGEAPQGEGRP